MKTVSIQELKAHLSALVAEAAAGTPVVITRHKHAVAQPVPVQFRDHIGENFGKARLRALLKNATNGRYLEVLADDRRGGVDDRRSG